MGLKRAKEAFGRLPEREAGRAAQNAARPAAESRRPTAAQARRRERAPSAGRSARRRLELLKLVREMLVIPAQLWLAAAEIAGAVVLAAWRRIVRAAARRRCWR